jgi:hypothetical protein
MADKKEDKALYQKLRGLIARCRKDAIEFRWNEKVPYLVWRTAILQLNNKTINGKKVTIAGLNRDKTWLIRQMPNGNQLWINCSHEDVKTLRSLNSEFKYFQLVGHNETVLSVDNHFRFSRETDKDNWTVERELCRDCRKDSDKQSKCDDCNKSIVVKFTLERKPPAQQA